MRSSRLTVTVPRPCPQKWQDMTPQEEGRFCHSCSTPVIDFTSMSNAEIAEWLGKAEGRVCGSFNSHQLGKEFTAGPASRRNRNWGALALGLAAWFSIKTAEAKGTTPALTVEIYPTATLSLLPLPQEGTQTHSDSALVVKGRVFDATTMEPLPGVHVRFTGLDSTRHAIFTTTDRNGNFSLTLPEEAPPEKLGLLIAYIGFVHQEIPLKNFPTHDNIIIKLKVDTRVLGEVVVKGIDFPKRSHKVESASSNELVAPPDAPQKKGFFQRIKNLFR